MSSWADQSEDPAVRLQQAPVEYTGADKERPRLKLKPRSATAGQSSSSSGGVSSKSNPFGAAKPREEVLASKGIDASLVDKRVERKANVPRLTDEQDRQVEDLRKELTEIEEKLREANEMELPEEDFRVAAESKRSELNDIMKGFHELNLKERNEASERGSGGSGNGRGGGGGTSSSSAGGGRKFERPSERRRRLEQQMSGGEGGAEDQYSSFGGNRGDGGGGGGSRNSDHGGSRGGGYSDRGGGYDDHNNGRDRGGGGGSQRGSNDNNNNDGYAADRYNY